MLISGGLRVGSSAVGVGEGAVDCPVGAAGHPTHRGRQQHRDRDAVQLIRRNALLSVQYSLFLIVEWS